MLKFITTVVGSVVDVLLLVVVLNVVVGLVPKNTSPNDGLLAGKMLCLFLWIRE